MFKIKKNNKKSDGSSLKLWVLIRTTIIAFIAVFLFVYVAFRFDWGLFVGYGLEKNSWLTFFGNLLGGFLSAITAVTGVWLTIKSSQQATRQMISDSKKSTQKMINDNNHRNDENRRLDVLPIVIVNGLVTVRTTKSTITSDANSDIITSESPDIIKKHTSLPELEDDSANEETIITDKPTVAPQYNSSTLSREIREFVFSIENTGVSVSPKLDPQQIRIVRDTLDPSKADEDYRFKFFKLVNQGKGVAVNFTATLFKYDSHEPEYKAMTSPLSLPPSEEYIISFFIYGTAKCRGTYELVLSYSDIFSNKYKQKHKIIIGDETSFSLDVVQEMQ